MSDKKTRLFSIAFVLTLALSGASLGFLVGRSQQLCENTDLEVIQSSVSTQVQSSGAVVAKAFKAVRYLLIH